MVTEDEKYAVNLPGGANHYRAYVGPGRWYDVLAVNQFTLLTKSGLRDSHKLLDIGCGSLRLGRLAIPYLRPGHYFGTEPNQWLIDEGIKNECGQDQIDIKQPKFSNSAEFELTAFGEIFDYLIAQSIFSHASKPQIHKCLSEAVQCMHTDSMFFASYLPGEKDYTGEKWFYPECCRYREKTMIGMAATHRLMCSPLGYEHPGDLNWLLFKRA